MSERFTLCHVEETTWVVSAPTGLASYDFEFAPRFHVRHPARLDGEVTAIARMGAASDYDARHRELLDMGIRLIHSPDEYRRTSLLPQCREWVTLRRVAEPSPDLLPVAFEFRSFWYRQRLVGIGPYWNAARYELAPRERDDALAVGQDAARRMDVPFVVVDLAQREDGRWIVIECNDGQDSGYAGVDRVALWRRVVAIDAG